MTVKACVGGVIYGVDCEFDIQKVLSRCDLVLLGVWSHLNKEIFSTCNVEGGIQDLTKKIKSTIESWVRTQSLRVIGHIHNENDIQWLNSFFLLF